MATGKPTLKCYSPGMQLEKPVWAFDLRLSHTDTSEPTEDNEMVSGKCTFISGLQKCLHIFFFSALLLSIHENISLEMWTNSNHQ